jgi:hypothetical protein
MPIEFKIRTDDLKRAAKQLQVNRGEFTDSDFAEFAVSACAVDITSVGTETRIVAGGKQTGSARLPLKVLARLVDSARSYHAKECTLLVDNGFVTIGRTRVSHPDIVVGVGASNAISIPINASALDTLAVATLVDPEKIADAGLRERVQTAQKRASAAVQAAADALREFGVSTEEITEILDRRVVEAAELIKSATRSES